MAEDRGGIPEDYTSFVRMLARLRQRLNSSGRKYGLTLTLVCNQPVYNGSGPLDLPG